MVVLRRLPLHGLLLPLVLFLSVPRVSANCIGQVVRLIRRRVGLPLPSRLNPRCRLILRYPFRLLLVVRVILWVRCLTLLKMRVTRIAPLIRGRLLVVLLSLRWRLLLQLSDCVYGFVCMGDWCNRFTCYSCPSFNALNSGGLRNL